MEVVMKILLAVVNGVMQIFFLLPSCLVYNLLFSVFKLFERWTQYERMLRAVGKERDCFREFIFFSSVFISLK